MVSIIAKMTIEGKYDVMCCGQDLAIKIQFCVLSDAVIEQCLKSCMM